MAWLMQKSNSTFLIPFKLVSSTDHRTPVTGASVSGTMYKNNASGVAMLGSVTEIANGWYWYDPNSGDTSTLGFLLMRFTATGADPAELDVQIVAFDPHDAVNLGLTALPHSIAGNTGGLIMRGTFAGMINPGSGTVPVTGVDVPGSLTGAVLPESYPADGAEGTVAQLLYLILANLGQFNVVADVLTALKLNGVDAAATYTLNDPVNPTGRVRTG